MYRSSVDMKLFLVMVWLFTCTQVCQAQFLDDQEEETRKSAMQLMGGGCEDPCSPWAPSTCVRPESCLPAPAISSGNQLIQQNTAIQKNPVISVRRGLLPWPLPAISSGNQLTQQNNAMQKNPVISVRRGLLPWSSPAISSGNQLTQQSNAIQTNPVISVRRGLLPWPSPAISSGNQLTQQNIAMQKNPVISVRRGLLPWPSPAISSGNQLTQQNNAIQTNPVISVRSMSRDASAGIYNPEYWPAPPPSSGRPNIMSKQDLLALLGGYHPKIYQPIIQQNSMNPQQSQLVPWRLMDDMTAMQHRYPSGGPNSVILVMRI